MQVIDLHTGRPLTQSDYTRSCINKIVLLRMSTVLLETCRGFKQTYHRTNCASSWSPNRIMRRCSQKNIKDENYVFVRPCIYVCPYCEPGEKGPFRRYQGPNCSPQSRTVITTTVVSHDRHEQEVFHVTTRTIAKLYRIGGR
jgi:hypothetical protein